VLIAQDAPAPQAFTLAHVTVVDVRDGALHRDQAVVVREHLISALGKAGSLQVPKGTRVIDASGKYPRHCGNVPMLAGSDTGLGNPYTFAAFSLHDELRLLAESGFTPLRALQAATFNPARFLKLTDSLGTVEPGKLADLVLLDANPTMGRWSQPLAGSREDDILRMASRGATGVTRRLTRATQQFASAFYKPGQMNTLLPHVARPEGRVHFAGEHTSVWIDEWMQRGVESGHRVAQEVNEFESR
jgi:hypothetical protein